MPFENATVAIFETPDEAVWAIQELRDAGFGSGCLSVAGKDSGAEEAAVCYYRAGNEVRYLGTLGAFWNRVWQDLPGWAFLMVPGVGPMLIAGALADWIALAWQNSSIFTGLSAFGAGLYSIGISKDAIAHLEAALATGKFVLIAHGRACDVTHARQVLRSVGIGVMR